MLRWCPSSSPRRIPSYHGVIWSPAPTAPEESNHSFPNLVNRNNQKNYFFFFFSSEANFECHSDE